MLAWCKCTCLRNNNFNFFQLKDISFPLSLSFSSLLSFSFPTMLGHACVQERKEVRAHTQLVYSCKVTYKVHMTSVMIIIIIMWLVIMIIVTLWAVIIIIVIISSNDLLSTCTCTLLWILSLLLLLLLFLYRFCNRFPCLTQESLLYW